LDVLQARADARKAREEMAEISGLAELREKVRQDLGKLKQRASASGDEVRHKAEAELHELQVEIERVKDRYSAWDVEREHRFEARLHEAEAKLKLWKARADQRSAERGMELHDTLADLEEKTELVRARFASWRAARHDRKAEAELTEARKHFDMALDAAERRYRS
jgi:hypothetical protein